MWRDYYVYIITNKMNTVLYTGVTNNLQRRIWQHKEEFVEGFSKKYKLHKLVYYEITSDVRSVIEREKQIKKGLRKRKIALIESMNPDRNDLYLEL